jgi:hypothetical protein
LADVQKALDQGVIDSYDILFLDGDTNPKIGWIDAKGKFRLVRNESDFSELEAIIAKKADADEVEAKLAKKADAANVEAMVDEITAETIESAKSYTDEKIEAAVNEYMSKKFEITHLPEHALVDYRDKEIRVMCPVNTEWVKQAVGTAGNENMYYMCLKAYAPDGAVSFKEGDKGVIIDEMFDFNGDFAGTDEYGRNYSICWLALASYDAASSTWTYFGKNSTSEKFIGWDYVVEWYSTDGIVIASDCMRINLSNESCYCSTKPYYVGSIMRDLETKIETVVDERIAEVESGNEIVEF